MTLLNLFFPPQCLNCKALVSSHGTLCLSCWQQIRFITEPFCARCGLPFEYALGEGAICGECIREEPVYNRARAAFKYDQASRNLVLKLKYYDQTHLAVIYGTWLAKAGRDLVKASDVIIPVPLYYWRFVGRRFNQSALLASALGRKTGLKVIPDGLKRVRATAPQAGLSRKQRIENVRGAFTAHPARKKSIAGKSVLLIDDVMTTSATLSYCAKALLKAGAKEVNVLTLARTAD